MSKRHFSVSATLAIALVVVGARTAAAEEPAAALARPPAAHAEWYGWQTLVADGVSLSVATGATIARSTTGQVAAWGTYVLAAPTVHALHGDAVATVVDLGMRLFVPVGGAIAGLAISGGRFFGCADSASGPVDCADDERAMLLGGAIGFAATSTVDALLLARERPSAPSADPVDRGFEPWTSLRVSPELTRGGIVARAVASF